MAIQSKITPVPGRFGLAKDLANTPIGPEWALQALNMIANDDGYLAARAGTTKTHASAVDGTSDIEQMFEYLAADGTSRTVYATATKLWEDTASPTNRTGAIVCTTGNWKFLNFNGKVLGWQAGEPPIVKTGAGNFAVISVGSGTIPDGNTACAAFGRVWGLDDDKQTIRYSALLDETLWDTADGGGLIDMRSVWSQGMDEVVEIVAYGSNLVVFGKKHIVIWTDGSGSQLGIDPDNMYVTDSIEGVGALGRDAVCLCGESDVVFLSRTGLRSLARTVQERATPAANLSPSNQRYIEFISSLGTASQIRMGFVPQYNWVICSIPGQQAFVLDLKQQTPDGGYRLTNWTVKPRSILALANGTLLFGELDSFIYSYGGELSIGSAFDVTFQTAWCPATESGSNGAFKAASLDVSVAWPQTFLFRWYSDFSTTGINENDPTSVAVGDSSGNAAAFKLSVPTSGSGQYFSYGVTVDNINADAGSPNVVFQSLTFFTKPLGASY